MHCLGPDDVSLLQQVITIKNMVVHQPWQPLTVMVCLLLVCIALMPCACSRIIMYNSKIESRYPPQTTLIMNHSMASFIAVPRPPRYQEVELLWHSLSECRCRSADAADACMLHRNCVIAWSCTGESVTKRVRSHHTVTQ